MGDEDKKQVEQKLWDIANELRGKMDADEFRDYILGFIFYKYLSEKILSYANKLLAEDGVTYYHLMRTVLMALSILMRLKKRRLRSWVIS